LAWLVHCGGSGTKGMAGDCFGAMYTHLLLLSWRSGIRTLRRDLASLRGIEIRLGHELRGIRANKYCDAVKESLSLLVA
jgi:hypothetical protein